MIGLLAYSIARAGSPQTARRGSCTAAGARHTALQLSASRCCWRVQKQQQHIHPVGIPSHSRTLSSSTPGLDSGSQPHRRSQAAPDTCPWLPRGRWLHLHGTQPPPPHNQSRRPPSGSPPGPPSAAPAAPAAAPTGRTEPAAHTAPAAAPAAAPTGRTEPAAHTAPAAARIAPAAAPFGAAARRRAWAGEQPPPPRGPPSA
mmetsp:Transcript_58278/g.134591  ORF Transcript_58278/g.134591 Transcript_58278/m.134591 type:complete len:201 (-) Transcript_58278:1451-2053(-)